MQSPSAADLLNLWERGRDQLPYERALLMLALAVPTAQPNELSGWGIGRRDAHLLQLREALFGPQLVSVADCPRCGTRLELKFTTTDLRAPFAEQEYVRFRFRLSGDELAHVGGGADDEYEGRLRPPNTDDLRALALAPSREQLIRRCLHEINRNGETLIDEALSPAVLTELSRRIEAADPQAVIELALGCVDCGCEWISVFDIVNFLWDEIQGLAARILREVHLLASAYGWGEAEILALSPQRRQSYLDLITE
jgi:hypothetical protein